MHRRLAHSMDDRKTILPTGAHPLQVADVQLQTSFHGDRNTGGLWLSRSTRLLLVAVVWLAFVGSLSLRANNVDLYQTRKTRL